MRRRRGETCKKKRMLIKIRSWFGECNGWMVGNVGNWRKKDVALSVGLYAAGWDVTGWLAGSGGREWWPGGSCGLGSGKLARLLLVDVVVFIIKMIYSEKNRW